MGGLVLTLHILPMTGLRQRQFLVPVDLMGPTTLEISPSQFGIGQFIKIVDEEGEIRTWYALEIYLLKFEYGVDPDEPTSSAEEVGVLSVDRRHGKEMWYMHLFPAPECV